MGFGRAVGVASAFAVVGFGGYFVGKEKTMVEVERMANILAEEQIHAEIEDMARHLVWESQTLSETEIEIYLFAQMLHGEAKGHENDWPHMASGTFNRVADGRWGNTVTEVLLKTRPNGTGCEIDAMCDRVMENLMTEAGAKARAFAATVLDQYHSWEFEPTHSGHSWATPAAAEGHAYFEGLCEVAQASGHKYFGDCEKADVVMVLPKLRPAHLLDKVVMAAVMAKK